MLDYRLSETDGVELNEPIAGNRLRVSSSGGQVDAARRVLLFLMDSWSSVVVPMPGFQGGSDEAVDFDEFLKI